VKKLDPDYFEEVDLNNPNRLMRAIEVCLLSGKKYSELRRSDTLKRDFEIIKIGLNTKREHLFQRINQRVDKMMEQGLLQEVKQVSKYRNYNSLNTVGYKELFLYIDGKVNLGWAVEKIKTNSRRYAKRQLTWFKKDDSIEWFEPDEIKKIIEFVVRSL
jgi:tRNA dimethylallyltransferase